MCDNKRLILNESESGDHRCISSYSNREKEKGEKKSTKVYECICLVFAREKNDVSVKKNNNLLWMI